MNQEQLLKHHQAICNEAFELMKKKNHDYAGKDGTTPFANFEKAEMMGLCSTEAGMMVRILDKISRITTYIDAGELKVENEGYSDAVIDLINYLVLFSGYIKSKEMAGLKPVKFPKRTG